jgi:hypothetical protein
VILHTTSGSDSRVALGFTFFLKGAVSPGLSLDFLPVLFRVRLTFGLPLGRIHLRARRAYNTGLPGSGVDLLASCFTVRFSLGLLLRSQITILLSRYSTITSLKYLGSYSVPFFKVTKPAKCMSKQLALIIMTNYTTGGHLHASTSL